MGFLDDLFGIKKEPPPTPAPPEMKVLRATDGFNLLIQSAADAIDAREEGIKAGILAEWMNQDEAIAVVYAYNIFTQYEKEYSPQNASSLLRLHCSEDMHATFVTWYCEISKRSNVKKTPEDIVNDKYFLFMEIEEWARGGKSVGWKAHWCPFVGEYESQWERAFSADGPSARP